MAPTCVLCDDPTTCTDCSPKLAAMHRDSIRGQFEAMEAAIAAQPWPFRVYLGRRLAKIEGRYSDARDAGIRRYFRS